MADSVQTLIDSFGYAFHTLAQKDAAVVKLRSFGAAAVGPLIEAIVVPGLASKLKADADSDNRQGMIQLYAARTLGLIGKSAAKAVPALADLFAKSRTALIRREAAIALSRIGPVQDLATNADVLYLMNSALNGNPDDWHSDVREAAVIALGAYGPSAKSQVTQLIPCLMDREERIRDAACHALVKIGPATIPALLDALCDRQRIRSELKEKGTLVLGTWAKTFSAANSDQEKVNSNWHVRQRTEECLLLEKIFESSVQILTKLSPMSVEFRAILDDLATTETNPKLQSLAKGALATGTK